MLWLRECVIKGRCPGLSLNKCSNLIPWAVFLMKIRQVLAQHEKHRCWAAPASCFSPSSQARLELENVGLVSGFPS